MILSNFKIIICSLLLSFSMNLYAADSLSAGGVLPTGHSLSSPNGQYKLTMQVDGNLVLYDAGMKALWASNTDGKAIAKCVMQSDGNLVLYLHNGKAVWASGTDGKPGARLVLQNDGNLVIYYPQAVWASNTNR